MNSNNNNKYNYIVGKDIESLCNQVETLFNELKRIKRRVYFRKYYHNNKAKIQLRLKTNRDEMKQRKRIEKKEESHQLIVEHSSYLPNKKEYIITFD